MYSTFVLSSVDERYLKVYRGRLSDFLIRWKDEMQQNCSIEERLKKDGNSTLEHLVSVYVLP